MKTLTLDYDAGKALLYYMCYKNDIKQPKVIRDDLIGDYFFGIQNNRRTWYVPCHNDWEKSRLSHHYERLDCLYSLLTLYDHISISPLFSCGGKIDSFDRAQLEEMGIIYNTDKPAYPSKNTLEDTISIMRLHKRDILDYLFNDDISRDRAYSITDEQYERYLDSKAYQLLFKEPFPDYDPRYCFSYFRNIYDSTEYSAFHYFDGYFLSISNALRNPNSTFYSWLIQLPYLKRVNANACKELNQYIVHADFSSGLSIVPKAENYRDIIELRKDPNLNSFREVFGEWVDYFVNGDMKSFEEIKQDVVKANENLTRLKKYERVRNSPIYNILSVLLGAVIPEMSFILGTLGVISSFYEPQIELKNCWVNLPAFHREIARYNRYDDSQD